ncbi:MAG: peptide chain release factor N(5)-glutamine methyltransferase [Oligoflexia bacterium]|nr:peptide chain release factor N(5)-glutamine methyltransferase [Oligoflexia bacterium]
MKLSDLLQKAKTELKSVSHQAYQESLWILSHTLNLPAHQVYLDKMSITQKQEEEFWLKIKQRKQAVPLEYILKEKFFLGHKFYVENPVFIPRPETETLIEWACKNISKNTPLKFADFGAGVGPIALSILSYFPNSEGVAIELHPKSIECLKKNSLNLKLQDRLYILKKDVSNIQPEDLCRLYLKIQKDSHSRENENSHPRKSENSHSRASENSQNSTQDDKFSVRLPDLITANPPYLDPKDKSIQPEVYLYESPLALFSDKKGLGHIISWFEKAIKLLKPRGIYIFEFAWNQKKQITEFLNSQTKINSYQILKDSLGYPRIAVCFKKNL